MKNRARKPQNEEDKMAESPVIIKKEIKVEKEFSEIGVAIAKMITVANSALEDGFQAGQDIPTVLMGTYPELSKAMEGIDKLGAAFKENPVASLTGLILPILEAVEITRAKSKAGVIKGNEVVKK